MIFMKFSTWFSNNNALDGSDEFFFKKLSRYVKKFGILLKLNHFE